MVEDNISKNSFDRMIKRNIFNPEACIKSAEHMYRLIDTIDGGIDGNWVRSTIDIENATSEFWYRNPIECIKFILGHAPFKKHLRYTPERDYDQHG